MEDQSRFLAWKKNAQHIYTTLLVYELPWPSVTVQWMPELISNGAKREQRIVLATNTGGQDANYLRIAELTTPEALPLQLGDFDFESETVGGFSPQLACDLRIVQRITVSGTVYQARIMPANCNLVSIVSSTGESALLDLTKFPYQPVADYVPTISFVPADRNSTNAIMDEIKSEVVTSYQSVCCSWSPVNEGLLAIGNSRGEVSIYDIKTEYDHKKSSMAPINTITVDREISDIQFHPRRPGTLAFVSENLKLYVYQLSQGEPSLIIEHSCSSAPSALAWNPANDSLMVVGLSSGDLVLFDLRHEAVEIYSFKGHDDMVTSIDWNTHHPSIFVSASADRTTKIWDATKFENKPLFVHAGHQAPVTDVHWNPARPAMLASVAEDNSLHVYEPASDIIGF